MKAKRQVVADSIQSRALGLIREYDLLGGQKRLLVAVSGGPDSVCLLYILANLQKELKVNLHVAHLDHGLRGAESEADARYVGRLAKKLDIPVTIEKRDVAAFRAKYKLSLEEAAREVRYEFFADVARAVGTGRVAVAHTGSDHIETVLMHLIRGSGIRGLRGLQPVNNWQSADKNITVVRPLLRVSRKDTEEYCRTLRLRPRKDSTNLSLTPFRNKVRLELLPLLEKYNPRISEALERTSVQATETAEFIDSECSGLWDAIVRQEEGAFVLDKSLLLSISPVLQRSLMLLVLEQQQGNLDDIESRHIDEITAAMKLPAGRRIDLPGGITFAVDYDKFLLTQGTTGLAPFPLLKGEVKLKVPGETRFSGWQVTAAFNSNTGGDACPAFTADLDFDKTGKDLTVRGLKAGDIFQPLGMAETKKVARFMIDARIPRPWRDRVPIVVSPDRIVWVAGWRIDERFKITEGTRNALRLEFKRI